MARLDFPSSPMPRRSGMVKFRRVRAWILARGLFCLAAGAGAVSLAERPPIQVEPGSDRFTGHALAVTIPDLAPVIMPDQPALFTVRLENRSEKALAGTVVIGGPTEGVYAAGDTEQSFRLEAGEVGGVDFAIAFGEGSPSGYHPVHVFVWATEGETEKARLVKLVPVDFGAPGVWRPARGEPVFADAIAIERGGPERMRRARLRVLADYLRELEGRPHDLVLPLGDRSDDFTVAVMPGEQGLLDGHLLLAGPTRELAFRGLHLSLEIPPGVDRESRLKVTSFEVERRENGFAVLHEVVCGEWLTQVTIEAEAVDGLLRLRARSPDHVAQFGLGPVDGTPVSWVAGRGWRYDAGEARYVGRDSPLLETGLAGFEFAAGISLVQAAESRLLGIEVDAARGVARADVEGSDWLYLAPCEGDVFEAALAWRTHEVGEVVRAPQVEALQERVWIHGEHGRFRDRSRFLEEAARYGVEALVYEARGWQKGGGDELMPDVWPPAERPGSLKDFQQFALDSRQLGFIWGLQGRFDVIDPRASDFRFDWVQRGFDGRPREDEAAPGGVVRYRTAPAEVKRLIEENLKVLRYHFLPRLAVIGNLPRADDPVWPPGGGAALPAEEVQQRWREAFQFARDYLSSDAVIVAEGGGATWVRGLADGWIWRENREALPAGGERVPWWSLIHHDALGLITPPGDASLSMDEICLEEILDGAVPAVDDRDWGRDLIRKAWWIQPVTAAVAGERLEEVEAAGEGDGRWVCRWSNGLSVWVNRGDAPWDVDDRRIASPGFWAEGAGLRGGLVEHDGRICEVMETFAGRYLRVRGEDERRSFGAPRLIAANLVDDGSACLVELGWSNLRSPGVPTRLAFCLGGLSRQADFDHFVEVESPRSSGVPAAYLLPLKAVPVGAYELSVTLLNPLGRPLPLEGKNAQEVLYPDFAIELGTLTVQRRDDAGVLEIGVAPVPSLPYDFGDAEEGEPLLEPGDDAVVEPVRWDWASMARGGFHLRVLDDGLRVVPLPDSPAFSMSIHLDALGIGSRRVKGVIAREAFGPGWEARSPKLEGERLVIDHEPKFFAYDLLLEP